MSTKPLNGFRSSTGKSSARWKTTAGSDLENVASQLAGNYDNAGRLKAMKERKMANNTTSIHFGNESINYVSDAQENQLKCFGGSTPAERAAQKERIRAMKAALTTTNFKLGDAVPEYFSVNQLAMAESDKFKGTQRVTMNKDVKEAVKKSSLHFGNEKVSYATMGQESMKYHGNLNNFAKLKENVRLQTEQLRKSNFTLGDEKVRYVTDYKEGYGSLPQESYIIDQATRDNIRYIINDSRSAHFSLGNDVPVYKSCNEEAAESLKGRNVLDDLEKQKERSKKMKAALQTTSIVIGDDEDYM